MYGDRGETCCRLVWYRNPSAWRLLPRLSAGLTGRARRGPVAHPLHVFFCVVAVAVAVTQSWREETTLLPSPQPLDRVAELTGGFRDPVRCASMLFHVTSIINDTMLRYRYFSIYRFLCQDQTTDDTWHCYGSIFIGPCPTPSATAGSHRRKRRSALRSLPCNPGPGCYDC